jgi:hypothetical protein
VHRVTGFKDGMSPRVELALRYWEAKRGERRMPALADIRLYEIPASLSSMLLLEVRREPLDFIVRFMGVGLRLRLGRDLTGGTITEIPEMRPGSRVWETYRMVVTERRAHLVEVPCIAPDQSLSIAQDMLMPLADDGETVDALFAVLDCAAAGPLSRSAA